MKDLILDYEKEAQGAWLLATLLRHPPTVEQLRSLREIEPDGSDGGFSGCIAQEDDLEACDMRLRVEHMRLFGGLKEGYGPRPPYESLWREGQMLADCTVALSELYFQAGYSRQASGVPADHLCEELFFRAALLNGEAEQRAQDNVEEADNLAAIREKLDAEHLRQWVPDYAKEMGAQTSEPFYKALSEALWTAVAPEAPGLRRVDGETNEM
ncbi:molecular chaperone [Tropicimonas sp. IMCC6043]|uniref:TorD/DmsD family molecular chaperone n=1 Tax=Tropicimonas sp. IMCC6043 TaxID=2510645 RepID=UPI00101C7417|nr:molecular chaperone TorD family protein [Tropicimonas sp. IMCC6043]RYH08833.1 hypothetical protein EU800_15245 [Tropicimonas sp. IMCC6043]